MTKFEYKFNFYTFSDIGNLKTFNNFIDKKFIEIVKPKAYDTVDHPKIIFKENEAQLISNFYSENGDLFIQGNKNLLIWFHMFTKNIHKWTFYIEKISDSGMFKNFIIEKKNLPNSICIFGYREDEHEFKHSNIQYLENGGRIEGALGISRQEFREYLPGIYSFTIFGTEIIEFFSRAKLEGMKTVFPNLEYFEGDNYFGFQIDDENQSLETVIQIQKEIAQYLGQEYFFDRDLVGIVDFKPIPTIFEKIK
jgi:hypothetical protein